MTLAPDTCSSLLSLPSAELLSGIFHLKLLQGTIIAAHSFTSRRVGRTFLLVTPASDRHEGSPTDLSKGEKGRDKKSVLGEAIT